MGSLSRKLSRSIKRSIRETDAGLPPVNTVAPVIDGGVEAYDLLAVTSDGTWLNAPTSFTYQWLADDVPITDANAASFQPLEEHVGADITCIVTARNSFGSASQVSNSKGPITSHLPVNTVAPTVTGTATQGQTLTYNAGTWTNSPTVTVQWRRNGAAISGATSTTYVLGSADIGAAIDVLETASNIAGAATQDSANTAAVAALVTGSTYNFTGTSGTLLTTLGWTLASPAANGNTIQINASNQIKRTSGGQGSQLILETGGGARTQKISADILALTNSYICVLAKWGATGIDAYTLRKDTSTTARVHRKLSGVDTVLQSGIVVGSGILTLEAVVASDDSQVVLKVYENGVQVGSTITDSSVSRYTRGRIGIYGGNAGMDPMMDTVTTYATDYFGGTGSVNNVSIARFGYETPANNGAMSANLASLGLLASGEVAEYTFTKQAGGPAAWPATVTGSNPPAPTVALTKATDASTTVVYDITIDGVATGKTYTVVMQPSSESVAAQTVCNQADIGRLTKASLGGKIVEFMQGCRDNFSAPTEHVAGVSASFTTFNTHTGTFTITTNGATGRIPALKLTTCVGVIVDNCVLDGYMPAWNGVGGSIWGPSNNQTWSTIQGAYLLNIASSDSITVTRCKIGPPDTITSPARWTNGLIVDTCTNVVIGATAADAEAWTPDWADLDDDIAPLTVGNVLRRGGTLIEVDSSTDITVRGNITRDFWNNGVKFGGSVHSDIIMHDFLACDCWINPAAPGVHKDAVQLGGSECTADCERIDIQRGLIPRTAGDAIYQGIFARIATGDTETGPTVNGGLKLSGYKFVDVTMKNIAYAGGMSNAFSWDLTTNITISNLSAMIGPLGYNYDPTLSTGTYTEDDPPNTVHISTGTAKNVSGVFNADLSASTTATDIYEIGVSGLAKDPSAPDPTARAAFYAALYDNVANADPIVAFKPKVGGPADLAGTHWASCFANDMSWATAA